jgi:hypothetical protein
MSTVKHAGTTFQSPHGWASFGGFIAGGVFLDQNDTSGRPELTALLLNHAPVALPC